MTSPESSSHAVSLTADLLQQEAIAAEDAGAERLLEADADLDTGGGAKEAMAMDHVVVPGRDLDRHDVPRHARGETPARHCRPWRGTQS
jgi:hypothetical protein